MLPPIAQDIVHGWVSSPNNRGTRDILCSCLATIWLCTWTCLCLNIPPPGSRRGYRVLLYKFRWQLFVIFFPEVLVATAAEQWLSARQSVSAFSRLGHPQWTIRHGFFADMGCVMVAPRDCEPFPVDSHQLEFLVQNKYLQMPDIPLDHIRSVNKADGLARLVTLIQMAWFCFSCVARGIEGLGFSTLEVTTLAFILCTLHNFFFWYRKPMDPEVQMILPMDFAIGHIRQQCGIPPDALDTYTVTPLDFVKPPLDPKSLVPPFWFGLNAVFGHKYGTSDGPAKSLPNSRVIPQYGVSLGMSIYMAAFQFVYYGLHIGFTWAAAFPSKLETYMWLISNGVDFGLILIYIIGIPIGGRLAPFFGRCLFDAEVTSVLEVASMLPQWAKFVIHAPFIFGYAGGRMVVLVESIVSLRALPRAVYAEVNWSGIIPHL